MDEFNEKLKIYKLPIALSLLGLVLILGGVFSSGLINFKSSPAKAFPKTSLVSESQFSDLKVDVSGAVIKAAVYSVPSGSRVEDAVRIAGGFSENANADYIAKNINLSQKISDGQKIYIPFKGEATGGVLAVSASGASNSLVNLNSASQSELEALPGIGAVTAQKIIGSRPYTTPDDLTAKKAVSSTVFNKIKDSITVN